MSEDFKISELDAHILELNHEDHSNRMISILLKERFGIEIGKSSVGRRLVELRQNPDNHVKTNYICSIPRPPKEEGKYYKAIERLKINLTQYLKTQGFKASSRTMYYQLIDEGFFKGSDSEHNAFVEATRKARLGWVDAEGKLLFPKLDIDCFADDESRKESYHRKGWNMPEEPTDPEPIEDPIEYADKQIRLLKNLVKAYDGIGKPGEDGHIGHRWYNQDEYVEVWQEKGDLQPAFDSILEELEVNVKSGKGYASLTSLNKWCDELKEWIDKYGFSPENIHILYCGDWDPSGENIDWYINKRLKQLGIEGIEFHRIAITPEQIDKYRLPLLDIGKAPNKQQANPNMKEFVRRHGNKATHLNAFFTTERFKTFKKILQDAVNDYWDPDVYQEMVDEYDVAADDPEEMNEEELAEAHSKMRKKITKAFRRGWNEYDDEDAET